MALISLSHLTMNFGGPTLFEDVTMDINAGAKIGIIGQNGTGKSTLLKLIAGELEPIDGAVFTQRGTKISYQAQELHFGENTTVIDEMRSLFAEDFRREEKLRDLEAKMADGDQSAKILADYDRLQAEHEAADAWGIDTRIKSVLSGLGLPVTSFERQIAGFSGGERNILGLAKAFLQSPDVMMLDEPSNHLDLDGIEWFIRFVRNSKATVVMVSHDRHLLDACATEIWEVKGKKITRWAGNYSDFTRQKEEALALQERQYKSQQRLIKRIEFQARRLKDMAKAYDDPGQAKRAKAMEKRLEMMEKIESPDRGERRFNASLSGAKRHGRVALSVKDFSFAWPENPATNTPERVLFDSAGVELEYGDRVALVGPNGSGKSTLFNAIVENATWENPTLRLGKSVKLGTYSQFHDEALNLELSLIDWALVATSLSQKDASSLLHRFMFSREDLDRPIGSLSGGEKSRLQLARLVHEKVNFLMLDEPTNHLDIQASEVLEEMLEEFDGTLLVISHDRYFLERLVTRVVEVKDRNLVSHLGSFTDWWKARQSDTARKGLPRLAQQAEAATQSSAALDREARKAAQRDQHRIQKAIRSLEDKIAKSEERQEKLEAEIAELFAADSASKKAMTKTQELATLRTDAAHWYQEWEALGEELAALDGVLAG